jgi:hypothetical protein
MAQFLRLPSGRGVNAELITGWGSLIDNGNGSRLYVYYNGSDESNDTLKDADARALYAWLEKNSTAIGEDGEAVQVSQAKRERDSAAARRAFLNALADKDVNAQYTPRIE